MHHLPTVHTTSGYGMVLTFPVHILTHTPLPKQASTHSMSSKMGAWGSATRLRLLFTPFLQFRWPTLNPFAPMPSPSPSRAEIRREGFTPEQALPVEPLTPQQLVPERIPSPTSTPMPTVALQVLPRIWW